MKNYFELIKKLKCIKISVVLMIFKVFQVLLSLWFALMMKKVIDDALSNPDSFMMNAILLCIVLGLQILMKSVTYYLEHTFENKINTELKRSLFNQVINGDFYVMNKYQGGELMNRFSQDTSNLSHTIASQIPNFVTMIIRIVCVLIVIMMMEARLALILVVGGMLSIVCAWVVKKYLRKVQVQLQKDEDQVQAYVNECFHSLLIIHSFHKQEQLGKIHQNKLEQWKQSVKKRIQMINLFDTCLNIAVNVGYAIGFLYSVYGVICNLLSIGSISAMVSLIGQIQGPFVSIGLMLPSLIAFSTSYERVKELYCEEKKENKRTVDYNKMEKIVFEDVCFAYDQQLVLNHFNLEINKNEKVAIVGYSGVGKSTVLKLMMNLYPIQSGRIYIKCHDEEINIQDIEHGLFAYVPQDIKLMSGTIKESIAFGCQEIDIDKVKQCANLAYIDEFIEGLEKQYDTYIKEFGASLSGGQMQRIAIARALYSDCKVLLFDEATASLDPKLEKQLLQKIKTIDNKTLIIVSHREEVMKNVDRCIVQSEV